MNRPPGKYIWIAIKAILVGWLVSAAIVNLLPYSGERIGNHTMWSAMLDTVFTHFVMFLWWVVVMAVWIVPTWLLTFLPLALLVPPESRLWRPEVIGLIGSLVGGLVFIGSLAVLGAGEGEFHIGSSLPLAFVASIVGLLTGLSMSLFMRRARRIGMR